MITRRTALAMLPASLMAGSSYITFARAQDGAPAIKYDPGAARRIKDSLDPYSRTQVGSPHYEATKPLIEFYAQIAELFINSSNSKSKLNTKADLSSALNALNKIYEPVNTVLSIRKKSDEIIESEKRRHISPQEKTRYSSDIDIKNSKINDIMSEQFSGPGDFDVNKVKQSKSGQIAFDKWLAMSEDLLRASINLSNWGPDAFYAIARGYATYQFSRLCLRTGRSPLLLARAYTLKVIGDSDSYFALRAASLTATPATIPSTNLAAGQTPVQGLTANASYAVEQDMIDKRLPREIYLGSELPSPENGCARGQVVNHYGRFTGDSNFNNGFKPDGTDGWSKSGCVSQLNDRGAEAMNGLLSRGLRDWRPKEGTEGGFRKTMREMTDALNGHIKRVKDRKQKEDGDNAQQPPPPPPPPTQNNPDKDIRDEFNVMQQMTSALRDVLAIT